MMKNVKIGQKKPKILQKWKWHSFFLVHKVYVATLYTNKAHTD